MRACQLYISRKARVQAYGQARQDGDHHGLQRRTVGLNRQLYKMLNISPLVCASLQTLLTDVVRHGFLAS